MADGSHYHHVTLLCDELILQVLYCLNGKTVLALSQTCRRFYRICLFDQRLWSRLCNLEFTIHLSAPDPFKSFQHLYKLLYQSREILKAYFAGNHPYCGNHRYGVLPSWLWTWTVLNTNPPLLPSWIRNYHEPFLRYKLNEISLGKVLRVWNLKSRDLPGHLVTRVEYGTSYYRWRDIQLCAMSVHGGSRGLERFMLRRCARARGYVERAFERLRNGSSSMTGRPGSSRNGATPSVSGQGNDSDYSSD